MTSNPLLKRLLGEAAPPVEEPPVETPPAEDVDMEQPAGEEAAEPPAQTQLRDPNTPPTVQELVRLWQKGDHMAVAARLMFTRANYIDFVELLFSIGREDGRVLGQLLDELADSESLPVPQTPPQYQKLLRKLASGEPEEEVL